MIFNKYILLITLFIYSGSFMNTPLQIYAMGLGLVIVCMTLLTGAYFVLSDKRDYLPYVKPLVCLLVMIPILGAYQASLTSGQGFIRGIETNFLFYGFTGAIYIFYCFRRESVTFKWFEKCVVSLGTLFFTLLTFLKIFYPYITFESSSWDGNRIYEFSGFQLNSMFILWAAFIFLARFRLREQGRWAFFAVVFFSFNVIFFNGRSFTFWIFLFFVTFVILEFRGTAVIKGFGLLLIIVFVVLILSITSTEFNDFLDSKVFLFNSAKAMFGHQNVDMSVQFRLFQFEQIKDLLSQHPVMGYGFYAPEVAINEFDYFQPSDLGVVGVFFNYGFLGLTVFLFVGCIFFWYLKRLLKCQNALLLGTVYFVFFRLTSSITTGVLVYKIYDVFLLFGVLLAGYHATYSKTYSMSNSVNRPKARKTSSY